MKRKYRARIREIGEREKIVEFEANSKEEAEMMTEDDWFKPDKIINEGRFKLEESEVVSVYPKRVKLKKVMK